MPTDIVRFYLALRLSILHTNRTTTIQQTTIQRFTLSEGLLKDECLAHLDVELFWLNVDKLSMVFDLCINVLCFLLEYFAPNIFIEFFDWRKVFLR